MRSAPGKAVRKRFEAELKRLAPEFKLVPHPIPGDRLFEQRLASGLCLYVMLEFHHMYDMFNVWMGWSVRGTYPTNVDLIAGSPESDDIRFPASVLWRGMSSDEPYWVLAPPPSVDRPESFLEDTPVEAALDKVEPAVQDAIQRIQEHVLPYLRRVTKAHGVGNG